MPGRLAAGEAGARKKARAPIKAAKNIPAQKNVSFTFTIPAADLVA
jgi:hypothetical protein